MYLIRIIEIKLRGNDDTINKHVGSIDGSENKKPWLPSISAKIQTRKKQQRTKKFPWNHFGTSNFATHSFDVKYV